MSLVQDIVPGRAVYHAGWYNALAVGMVILAARGLRRAGAGGRIAFAGAALLVAAGTACGLMGPDTQTIVGAPGATVDTPEFGQVRFPLEAAQIPARRYAMTAIFSSVPRDVVHVRAFDARGDHVTLTQPSGVTFLSPVLLMQQTAQIAGMNVRTDDFALPALSRTVKAVYFTPAQAALLRSQAVVPGSAAILFDVSDARGKSLPHGLAIGAPGTMVRAGGVVLQADVEQFPGIQAAAAPFLPFVLAGLLAFAAGAAKSSSRSKT